ncbi:hypothetical protein [Thermosipho melanesiensis]|uniref:Uncharacterized protein n=2 Tax=Thermosipho melanesiensis TaxID=46541 RepID=A6LNG0_THEM4|nr:hypothetical protein [Thermosipho melanesiensis]ABR31461.1 hypothetical protein Tmel_1617 [Thermosipho melanesiensis BI429]
MKKLIIYLLLSIGFVTMIMPFAWMLITSFKMPSEIQQWPPKWYTKNFFSSRQVKVKTKIGAVRTLKGISLSEALSFTSSKMEDNILSISVEDDPFYRGTMTLNIKGFDYTDRLSKEEFEKWLKNVSIPIQLDYDTPEEFFEEVFLYFKSGSKPYFNRLSYFSELDNKFNSVLSAIDLILRFVDRRIKDENEREIFSNFLSKLKEDIVLINEKAKIYKAGKYLVLEDNEIKEIYNLLSSLNLNYTRENSLIKIFESKVVDVINYEKELLNFYLKVYKYFKNIQNKKVESFIVAKVMSKDEKIKLLKENIKKINNPLLEKLLENDEIENLPEKFSKEVDSYFVNEYNINTAQLNSLKSVVVGYKNLLIEKGIGYIDILKKYGFEKLKFISDEKLRNSSTYRIFLAKVESISSKISSIDDFLSEFILFTDYVDEVRRIYNNSMNEWKIIEAPEFVKSVRVKNGEVIEIELSGVSPVYLSDNNLSVASLKFSLIEVFKNIFQNYVDA